MKQNGVRSLGGRVHRDIVPQGSVGSMYAAQRPAHHLRSDGVSNWVPSPASHTAPDAVCLPRVIHQVHRDPPHYSTSKATAPPSRAIPHHHQHCSTRIRATGLVLQESRCSFSGQSLYLPPPNLPKAPFHNISASLTYVYTPTHAEPWHIFSSNAEPCNGICQCANTGTARALDNPTPDMFCRFALCSCCSHASFRTLH